MSRPQLTACEGRHSLDRIRHPRQRAFLAVYAESCSVVKAARSAKIHRSTHYVWLNTDPDYARAFHDIKQQSVDILEAEALRRALEGIDEYVLYKGQPIRDPESGEWIRRTRYSDALLFRMLQAVAPEKYRENHKPVVEGDGVRVAGRSREEVIREEIEARQHALKMLEESRRSVERPDWN